MSVHEEIRRTPEDKESGDNGFMAHEQLSLGYRNFLKKLQSLLTRIAEQSSTSRTASTINIETFESICDELTDAPYAEIIEEIFVVGVRQDQFVLSADLTLDQERAGAAIIEVVRSSFIPVQSTKELTPVEATFIENLTDGNIPSAKTIPAQFQDMLEFAKTAGLVREQDGKIETLSADLNIEERMRMLDLIILIHNSESVAGVTQGWSRLVVDNPLYKSAVDADDRAALEEDGYVHTSKIVSDKKKRNVMLVSVAPLSKQHVKDSYVVDPHHQLDLDRSANSETEAALVRCIDTIFEKELGLPIEDLPGSIRIATHAVLSAELKKQGVPGIRRVSKKGYIALAHHVEDRGKPASIVYRNQETGSEFRSYFVAKTKEAMRRWKNSAKYQDWIRNDRMDQYWQEKWNNVLLEHSLGEAGFVPKECQPAYIVPYSGVQKAQETVPRFGRYQVMLAQSKSQKGREALWLFFPEEAGASRYKRFLSQQGHKTPLEQTQARSEALFDWQVKQLVTTPEWNQWPVPEGCTEDVRIMNLESARAVVDRFPPLSTYGMNILGYALTAQSKPAKKGKGLIIICPNGRNQSDEIKKQDWYKELMEK